MITSTTVTQKIFRVLLGTFLVFAGTGHLTYARQEFQAQVPDWVPVNKDLIVILSGIVEILLGACIALVKKWRMETGLIAATFFVLVFPGNLAQYLNRIDAFGLDTDGKRLARLFFQPVLIAWALWSTGALKKLRSRKITLKDKV